MGKIQEPIGSLSEQDDIATENAEIVASQPRNPTNYLSIIGIIVLGVIAVVVTRLLLPLFTPAPVNPNQIIPINNTSNNASLANSTPCTVGRYNITTNTITSIETRCNIATYTNYTPANYLTPALTWSIVMWIISLIIYPMLDKKKYPSQAIVYLFVFSFVSGAAGLFGISSIAALIVVWWILYHKRLISGGLMNI